MKQTESIVATLKKLLRSHKITYAQIASELGLSESSIKRQFSSQRLSLENLERIAEMAGFSLAELTAMASSKLAPITVLTEEQEKVLIADGKLILVTYLVLNGWAIERIISRFQISEAEVIKRLIQLDRLGMIELLPGNRIRRLVARNFSWRKHGPVDKWFQHEVQQDFFETRFAAENEQMHFVGGLLSASSLRRLQQRIDKLTAELDDLIEQDADLPIEDKQSVGAVFASRPWEVPLFRAMKRNPD